MLCHAPSAWPAGSLVQIVLEELTIVSISDGAESAENQVGAVQQHMHFFEELIASMFQTQRLIFRT